MSTPDITLINLNMLFMRYGEEIEREAHVPLGCLYLTRALGDARGPFVAASDFMKLVPEQIARFLPGRLVPLGTDGFGLSDTRQALRRHFEVDAEFIALAALDALRAEGQIDGRTVTRAIRKLKLDPDKISAPSI